MKRFGIFGLALVLLAAPQVPGTLRAPVVAMAQGPAPAPAPVPSPAPDQEDAKAVITVSGGKEVPPVWPLGTSILLTAERSVAGTRAGKSIQWDIEPAWVAQRAEFGPDGRTVRIESGSKPKDVTVTLKVAKSDTRDEATVRFRFAEDPDEPGPAPAPRPDPAPAPTPDPGPAPIPPAPTPGPAPIDGAEPNQLVRTYSQAYYRALRDTYRAEADNLKAGKVGGYNEFLGSIEKANQKAKQDLGKVLDGITQPLVGKDGKWADAAKAEATVRGVAAGLTAGMRDAN